MKKWLNAFRLRTLPLALSTVIMGAGTAYIFQPSTFKQSVLWLTIVTTIFLQVLSNLANDYGDAQKGADNEGRIGPKRTIQAGLITKKAMLRAMIVCVILALGSGVLLLFQAFEIINWLFLLWLVIGIGAIGAAIAYTVGKTAYGYKGLGDVFVFLFFGIVGVYGTFFLFNHEPFFPILLPATTIGCLSAAVLNLNNMRDHENDAKVGKNTIVVKMGLAKAKIYHYLLFILAYLSLSAYQILAGINFIGWIIIGLFLIIHLLHLVQIKRITEPAKFDPFLKIIALSTFGLSLLYSLRLVYNAY